MEGRDSRGTSLKALISVTASSVEFFPHSPCQLTIVEAKLWASDQRFTSQMMAITERCGGSLHGTSIPAKQAMEQMEGFSIL